MKFVQIALGASIALAPLTAHARTWVMENVQDATCDPLPEDGIASPADMVNYFRNQDTIPTVTQTNGPDGQLATVQLVITQAGGNQVEYSFFTSLAGCQAQLKADIADGSVTDPNALK
jgi:hypothetical protein